MMGPEVVLVAVLVVVLARFLVTAVLAPVRVRVNNCMRPGPSFEPCDGERLAPDVVRRIAALGELGFLVRGTWRNVGHTTSSGQITLLEHPKTLDVAKVLVATAGKGRQVVLVFQTRFDDGEDLATSDTQTSVGLPRLPETTVLWLPAVRDARDLYRVHEQARDVLGRGRRRRPLGPDAAAFLREGRERILARYLETGYDFFDEARGLYRPTWKGAFLMTWRLMWPIRPLYRAWRRRPTNKLLDELGIHPDAD